MLGLSRLLRLSGHDVQTAYDGKGAIDVAADFAPRFVFMDIGLPDMDGFQVAARLRELDCCKDSLLVAISGYGQPEHVRRSQEAGFDRHLIKPVDLDALTAILAEP